MMRRYIDLYYTAWVITQRNKDRGLQSIFMKLDLFIM